MNWVDTQHCKSRAHCATCRSDPEWRKNVGAPEKCPYEGIGTWLAKIIKPIGTALKLPCYDEKGNLKPESGCAKRRDALDRIGKCCGKT